MSEIVIRSYIEIPVLIVNFGWKGYILSTLPFIASEENMKIIFSRYKFYGRLLS